jgi:hypothetical protein
MDSGNPLVETWIPDGGFRIERRKIKTPDGGSALAECLVPKWTNDDLTPDHPCARQPCLHRVLADCPPTPEGILSLSDRYGLLTVTIPRKPSPGEKLRADVLPPEPLDIWRAEIRALRTCTDLWDSIAGGNGQATATLNRRLAEKLAGARFHLTACPGEGRFLLAYRPLRLVDAVWQRFAEEISGRIQCVRCPAPKCGRWLLKGAARSDRVYCSNVCKNQVFRAQHRRQR